MLISFHYLLHIVDCIKDCGPCWATWQFPMERLCGILLPLTHSRLYPYINLTNNILLTEKFNHLFFISGCDQIFDIKNSEKEHPLHKIFVLENQNEKLYFPRIQYELNLSEIRRLKHYYSQVLKVNKKNMQVYNLFKLITLIP